MQANLHWKLWEGKQISCGSNTIIGGIIIQVNFFQERQQKNINPFKLFLYIGKQFECIYIVIISLFIYKKIVLTFNQRKYQP